MCVSLLLLKKCKNIKKGQVIIFARVTPERAIKALIVLTNEAPTDY